MPTQRPHPQTDLELLSALFDGELEGDAGRFAIRRLGHDASWRDACGRWQLAGDVLRSHASGVAVRDFPQRVASAMAAEAATEEAVPARRAAAPDRGRSRWVPAAAIAASMAVVALFAVRPGVDTTGPEIAEEVAEMAPPEAPAASGADTGDAPAGGYRTMPAPAPAMLASQPGSPVRPAAAGGVSSRSQAGSAVIEPERIEVPELMLADNAIPAELDPSVTRPFMPSPEIVARPWPRAVLPGARAADGFTAGFVEQGLAPSFYPFDPLLPEPHADAAAEAPLQTD